VDGGQFRVAGPVFVGAANEVEDALATVGPAHQRKDLGAEICARGHVAKFHVHTEIEQALQFLALVGVEDGPVDAAKLGAGEWHRREFPVVLK
jgi:hypothetical protein